MINKDFDKGQHFLIDSKVIKKEIEIANISKKDKVIEIGAGEGILTFELVKKAGKVIAFEVDKRYSEKLNSFKKKNLRIIYDDALKYSWKGMKIVSNIPYVISEQIILKSIEDKVSEMVLIVGERLKEKLKEKNSKIGIIANLFYNINFIIKVEKKCFSPSPRVDSWMIRFERKKKFSEKEKRIIYILRGKGKLKNSLMSLLVREGKTKNQAREKIKNLGLHGGVLEKPIGSLTGRVLLRLRNILEKDF